MEKMELEKAARVVEEAGRIVEALAGLDLSRMQVLMMEDAFKDAREAERREADLLRRCDDADDRIQVLLGMLAEKGLTKRDIWEECQRGEQALEEERQKIRDANRW